MVYTETYTPWKRGEIMKETTLFLNNKTQSVRIPKDDVFSGKKVFFEKIGDIGIIIDEKQEWAALKLLQLLDSNYLNFNRAPDKYEVDNKKAKAKIVDFDSLK